jgi:hypothetical protein
MDWSAARGAGLALGLAGDTQGRRWADLEAFGGNGLVAIFAQSIAASGHPIKGAVNLHHIFAQHPRNGIAAHAIKQGNGLISGVVAITGASIFVLVAAFPFQPFQPRQQFCLALAQFVHQPWWNQHSPIFL